MMNFETPVVLIIYNRPDKTKKVFEAIRLLKPSNLFIIADGPKNADDEILCLETRKITSQIDWEVNLRTDIASHNLGNAQRTITGLNRVFEEVEDAIILEDDCVPHQSFFKFCSTLLHKYKHDPLVMHISGCNLLQKTAINSSYFFSRYMMPPWGWATWQRAWGKFNPDMDSWQKHKAEIHPIISQENFKVWTDTFEYLRVHKVTWDIPWNIDIWANKGIGILPAKNLVSNIGFDEEATFTKKHSTYSSLPATELAFPLIDPADKSLPFDKELEAACIDLLKSIS
jgi:hypothetical protein